MKNKVTKKMKKTARRQAVKPAAPGQAADILKTFMKLERIKGRIVPGKAEFLSRHDKWENLLDLTRSVRDAGKADDDEAFFYMAVLLDRLSEERIKADAKLAKISAAIRKKEKEAGLAEDEYWPAGEAPDDVEELEAGFEERCRQIDVEVMREHGEDEMADLYLNDEKEFYRRRTRGALLLAKDDEEKLKEMKKIFRELIVRQGWSDLLPGLDM